MKSFHKFWDFKRKKKESCWRIISIYYRRWFKWKCIYSTVYLSDRSQQLFLFPFECWIYWSLNASNRLWIDGMPHSWMDTFDSLFSIYSHWIFYQLSPWFSHHQSFPLPHVPLDCKLPLQCHSFLLLLCVHRNWCHTVETSNIISLPSYRATVLISLVRISNRNGERKIKLKYLKQNRLPEANRVGIPQINQPIGFDFIHNKLLIHCIQTQPTTFRFAKALLSLSLRLKNIFGVAKIRYRKQKQIV